MEESQEDMTLAAGARVGGGGWQGGGAASGGRARQSTLWGMGSVKRGWGCAACVAPHSSWFGMMGARHLHACAGRMSRQARVGTLSPSPGPPHPGSCLHPSTRRGQQTATTNNHVLLHLWRCAPHAPPPHTHVAAAVPCLRPLRQRPRPRVRLRVRPRLLLTRMPRMLSWILRTCELAPSMVSMGMGLGVDSSGT